MVGKTPTEAVSALLVVLDIIESISWQRVLAKLQAADAEG
jgi:hypothetical protein